MKLSISNIAWAAGDNQAVYSLMAELGFTGLEIAPTKLFPDAPYEKLDEAAAWSRELKARQGLLVPSMQSIWYGRAEKLFGSPQERQALVDYTKKAIDFARAIGCRNLVFGCPRNRYLPEGADEAVALDFFRQIGDYAHANGCVIGMEANPPIYNTNYINTTASALELIRQVNSPGFLLNLDVGTMVHNWESPELLRAQLNFISHVHISEPGLAPIAERHLHRELISLLKAGGYEGYVSLEMGQQPLCTVEKAMKYLRELSASA